MKYSCGICVSFPLFIYLFISHVSAICSTGRCLLFSHRIYVNMCEHIAKRFRIYLTVYQRIQLFTCLYVFHIPLFLHCVTILLSYPKHHISTYVLHAYLWAKNLWHSPIHWPRQSEQFITDKHKTIKPDFHLL